MTDPNDEPVYVISVAARLAGLPTWFLRVLDDEGVVVPVRTDTNRRLYSDNDVARLVRVRHLTRDRKVNVDGVKVILEMEREREQERRDAAAAAAPLPPAGDLAAAAALSPRRSMVGPPPQQPQPRSSRFVAGGPQAAGALPPYPAER